MVHEIWKWGRLYMFMYTSIHNHILGINSEHIKLEVCSLVLNRLLSRLLYKKAHTHTHTHTQTHIYIYIYTAL